LGTQKRTNIDIDDALMTEALKLPFSTAVRRYRSQDDRRPDRDPVHRRWICLALPDRGFDPFVEHLGLVSAVTTRV
jgi:hypothetical protein